MGTACDYEAIHIEFSFYHDPGSCARWCLMQDIDALEPSSMLYPRLPNTTRRGMMNIYRSNGHLGQHIGATIQQFAYFHNYSKTQVIPSHALRLCWIFNAT